MVWRGGEVGGEMGSEGGGGKWCREKEETGVVERVGMRFKGKGGGRDGEARGGIGGKEEAGDEELREGMGGEKGGAVGGWSDGGVARAGAGEGGREKTEEAVEKKSRGSQ